MNTTPWNYFALAEKNQALSKPSSQPVQLNYPIRGFNSASASGTTSRPQSRSCYGLHLASGYSDQGELTASTIL